MVISGGGIENDVNNNNNNGANCTSVMTNNNNNNNNVCSTPGCTNVVQQLLACPKCIQLGLPPTYFCGQQCYKDNYTIHKKVHTKATSEQKQQQQQKPSFAPPAPLPTAPIIPVHRKTPPSDGVSCLESADPTMKMSLPTWANYYDFTGSLRPALYSPQRKVSGNNIRKPDYADHPAGISDCEQKDRSTHNNIRIYTRREIDGIDCDGYGLKHACQMGREVLDIASSALRPGITTDEIDRIVYDACIERNIYPSPLNYYNFPKSVCTSVNEVICHGIPDYRELCDGDICNIDVSVYNAGGYHGDLNETFFIGKCDDDSHRLVKTSFDCLAAAIDLVKPGTLYRDIGNTIEKIAKQNKCSVVRTYCGHGIGSLFHTIPNIPHYAKNKAKGVIKAGHVFTIEPMINLGRSADKTWDDHWTAVTCDGLRSSQFEHTLYVTDTGYEILTAREDEPIMKWNPILNQR